MRGVVVGIGGDVVLEQCVVDRHLFKFSLRLKNKSSQFTVHSSEFPVPSSQFRAAGSQFRARWNTPPYHGTPGPLHRARRVLNLLARVTEHTHLVAASELDL
jgi:hypothetical protein